MTTRSPDAYGDIPQSNKSPEELAQSVGISLDKTTGKLLIDISDEVKNHNEKLGIAGAIIFRLVKFCVTHFGQNVSTEQILNSIPENTRNHLSEMGIPPGELQSYVSIKLTTIIPNTAVNDVFNDKSPN